eukprot:TRINITY_DN2198_c0_g4_i1.p1 TRINITY_DN2198_c0_g4~~TRINITY_DN2198_c0_g4_i1.p1  ORF type:complete len:373 (+),score=114.74 TRINITY_DN2198_c0_g4_i1:40-1158(+)
MVRLEFKFGVYEGEVDEEGLRHGKGKLTYTNGNMVNGTWVKGAFTGKGQKLFGNGDRYAGHFKEGKKHGFGKYVFAGGGSYTGEYVDDLQHGDGVWELEHECYTGQYKEGQRSGKGIEILKSSPESCTTYEGDWLHSKRHGQGRLTLENGVYWEGKWFDGKKVEAEGCLYEADGTEIKDTPTPPQSASTEPLPDISNLSKQPEMQALLAALSQQGDNPDMAALQQTLLQTCKGMENFGANITSGLSKASSGLDALEGQLEDLTAALGIEDEDAMNEKLAQVTSAIKQKQEEQEQEQEAEQTETAECGTSPIEELDDDDESTVEPEGPRTVQEQPPSAEEHADFLDRIDLLNNKLLSQVLAAEAELQSIRQTP